MDINQELIKAVNLSISGDHHAALNTISDILKKEPSNPEAFRIMGEIFFFKKDYFKAIIYFEKSLEILKRQPQLINNCGICYLEINDLKKAIKYFDLALSCDPNFQDALFNKALALEKENKISDAINIHQNIISINTSYTHSYHKLTSLFLLGGNYLLAYDNLNELEKNNPGSCDAIFFQERSLCALNLRKVEEALSDLNKSIELNPNLTESFNNRGNIYKELNQDDLALKDFNQAILINKYNSDAYLNLSGLFQKLKKFDLAILNINKAIEINSANYNFYINRSAIHREMKAYQKALQDANKAISLSISDISYKCRSDCYVALGDYEAAIKDLTVAIQIAPKPSHFTSRGLLYLGVDKFNECEKDYSRKVNSNDDLTELQKFDLSILYFSLGKFDIAWKYYYSRLSRDAFKSMGFSSPKKKWNSKKDFGTVYVYNEQGIGDQLIFSSLLSELLLTNNVILSIDPRLVEVYKRSFRDKNIDIFPREVLDHSRFVDPSLYDFHISLGDLGGVFRKHIKDFENQPKKFLLSDSNKLNQFKNKIQTRKKILCGVSWMSKGAFGDFKNLALPDLLPIFKIDAIDFVNLQYGDIDKELAALKNDYNISINNLHDLDLFQDLDGLFSLVDACDVIVTTCNVTAHVAGSLGKETYLLSPFGPGKIWYWRLFDSKNLWYPSIKVFEQKNNDWGIPINQLAQFLENKFL